jgi:hypothetical protein
MEAYRIFWRFICLFAYRRAALPVKTAPPGLPFMRDPSARCDNYEPRKYLLGDFRDCKGDGHYLCAKCCHKE